MKDRGQDIEDQDLDLKDQGQDQAIQDGGTDRHCIFLNIKVEVEVGVGIDVNIEEEVVITEVKVGIVGIEADLKKEVKVEMIQVAANIKEEVKVGAEVEIEATI